MRLEPLREPELRAPELREPEERDGLPTLRLEPELRLIPLARFSPEEFLVPRLRRDEPLFLLKVPLPLRVPRLTRKFLLALMPLVRYPLRTLELDPMLSRHIAPNAGDC